MFYKVYVCGPTVYNHVHIGNIRPILSIDLVLKAARNLGKNFQFVHNITDIDDKIIQRALQENVSEKEIAQKYTIEYFWILKKLNIDTISKIEFVTQNLIYIENFIENLISSKNAYKDREGNVWFDVEKNKKNYGLVSNQKLENMKYQETEYLKRHQADFSIWKNTIDGIRYKTKFGYGRPGWHTECCALIYKNFGSEGVDVHGGGVDLTFPHHENENIQFFALTGNNIAKKWVHSGMLNLNGVKMSKTFQNVILAKNFLQEYDPDVLKFIILINSFTGIINIDDNLIHNVNKIINKIKKIYFNNYKNHHFILPHYQDVYKRAMNLLLELNFSDFMTLIHKLIKESATDFKSNGTLVKIFNDLEFNFKKFDYKKYLEMMKKWEKLSKEKNFTESDLIREILIKEGIF
ncbi:class I tRNA ligase family protein [Mycoplasmopsis cricetuli]|uniref:class I tRNA ligase family protein n=1 Tax=Mycoplasmopsis cricetuli TaxID=171283 RepID=UPI0004720D5B|nr:class I tRNA ligase family protein [Mycoplasmopsis cricetuli]